MRKLVLRFYESGGDKKSRSDSCFLQGWGRRRKIVSVPIIKCDNHRPSPHRFIGGNSFAQLAKTYPLIMALQVSQLATKTLYRLCPHVTPADSVIVQNNGARAT